MSMSLYGARVVDPVLTTYARGYKHPDRVGSLLFPMVDVGVTAGKVIEFGKESFILYNARRAPGGSTRQIEFGYQGKGYELVQDSLDAKIPREYARDAMAVPGIDLGMRAVNLVMNTLSLGLEFEQAKIATDILNYDANHNVILSGTSQWSDPASNPNPIASPRSQSNSRANPSGVALAMAARLRPGWR